MKTASNKADLERLYAEWRDGSDGFLKWVSDIKPRVLTSKNRYEVFVPADFQIEAIRGALTRNPDGTWKNLRIAISMPRRHSKTTLAALLCLWRFSLWENENIVAIANSEDQVKATGFGMCRKIVLNTPFLARQIGRKNVYQNRIDFPERQSSIRLVATNVSALFGEKITVGWCSEIHAAANIEAYQVISSSLGDSEGAWLLIDSTVDSLNGPLHALEKAQADPEIDGVYVYMRSYRDLADACENSPPWIDRRWLRLQEKSLPPAMFGSQHLNLRSEAQNNLFRSVDVDSCMDSIPHPVSMEELRTIADGRSFACGGGFDRAVINSRHGDNNIWTVTAKLAREGGEDPEYIVLRQELVDPLDKYIKRRIEADFKQYNLQNVCLESFNTADVFTWCVDQGIPSEHVFASQRSKEAAFMALYRAVSQGRLHFSEGLKDLADEMRVFPYEISANGQPSFGQSRKFKDDRVFSLAWSIYALRDMELSAFVLHNMMCVSRSPNARLCYLREGNIVLRCSDMCGSHKSVNGMFLQYKRRNVESEISLQDFFKQLVKLEGVRIYK